MALATLLAHIAASRFACVEAVTGASPAAAAHRGLGLLFRTAPLPPSPTSSPSNGVWHQPSIMPCRCWKPSAPPAAVGASCAPAPPPWIPWRPGLPLRSDLPAGHVTSFCRTDTVQKLSPSRVPKRLNPTQKGGGSRAIESELTSLRRSPETDTAGASTGGARALPAVATAAGQFPKAHSPPSYIFTARFLVASVPKIFVIRAREQIIRRQLIRRSSVRWTFTSLALEQVCVTQSVRRCLVAQMATIMLMVQRSFIKEKRIKRKFSLTTMQLLGPVKRTGSISRNWKLSYRIAIRKLDQLNIRTVEANIMGEHIHSLELKLTELEKFPERVRVMDNELARSDSQCWLLMEDVRSTLEQRLFDAESLVQHAAEHKARIDKQLGEHELQLHEAQKTIDQLVLENKQLKELLPARAPKRSPSTAGEHLDKTLENGCHVEYERDNVVLERMAKQNEESELLIEQLKEELREQKLKAKEDAEDLTQEMAELRYQITGMLEEEYKRRSCIEQAAIQHIQELEAQVTKEKRKLSGALRRLQESQELAHTQAMEMKKLKDSLERINSAVSLGTVCKSCSCGFCAMLIELSTCSIGGSSVARSPNGNHIDEKPQNPALIEWRPDETSDGDSG
ncbi:hypothetical protein EJB05_11445, partial [Eragrostis curvula]